MLFRSKPGRNASPRAETTRRCGGCLVSNGKRPHAFPRPKSNQESGRCEVCQPWKRTAEIRALCRLAALLSPIGSFRQDRVSTEADMHDTFWSVPEVCVEILECLRYRIQTPEAAIRECS